MNSRTRKLHKEFIALVGEQNALTSQTDISPYLTEWRDYWKGRTALVLKPNSTKEVANIMRLATETLTAIVPQGGHTGLVGGAMPDGEGNAVVLSTERLNKIRDIDVIGNSINVEAGCILQHIQEVCVENDRFFPLSLASEGTCQIGGNLSTNAGGTGALAYGVARDLVLGLEVVLPTGEILSDLNRLKKDNAGYNLRNLFIGAEGTLGVITAAVLKMFPKPKGKATAFVSLKTPQNALDFFMTARDLAGHTLTAFELIPRIAVEFSCRHMSGVSDPLSSVYPWYVLVEISSYENAEHANRLLSRLLETQMQEENILDGAVASSIQQSKTFWHLRETISESQKLEGGSIKHDISVPIFAIPAFMDEAQTTVLNIMPDARICAFGHVGDGNLHYNISQPTGANRDEFLTYRERISRAVHALVLKYNGSISAEHGIGQMKREELAQTKDPVYLNLMHRIKAELDPANIMNPGKIL